MGKVEEILNRQGEPGIICCYQVVAWVMLFLIVENCLGLSLRRPSNRDALPTSVLSHYPPTQLCPLVSSSCSSVQQTSPSTIALCSSSKVPSLSVSLSRHHSLFLVLSQPSAARPAPTFLSRVHILKDKSLRDFAQNRIAPRGLD